jgi:hypothetical protein
MILQDCLAWVLATVVLVAGMLVIFLTVNKPRS